MAEIRGHWMNRLLGLCGFLIASVISGGSQTATTATSPSTGAMKVGIVGLVHGHVESFLGGGNLNPAGSILKRPDTELVGIVEPDDALFDKYAQKYHLPPSMHFKS